MCFVHYHYLREPVFVRSIDLSSKLDTSTVSTFSSQWNLKRIWKCNPTKSQSMTSFLAKLFCLNNIAKNQYTWIFYSFTKLYLFPLFCFTKHHCNALTKSFRAWTCKLLGIFPMAIFWPCSVFLFFFFGLFGTKVDTFYLFIF